MSADAPASKKSKGMAKGRITAASQIHRFLLRPNSSASSPARSIDPTQTTRSRTELVSIKGLLNRGKRSMDPGRETAGQGLLISAAGSGPGIHCGKRADSLCRNGCRDHGK